MRSLFEPDDSQAGVQPEPRRSEFYGEQLGLETSQPRTFDAAQVLLPAAGPRDIAVLQVTYSTTVGNADHLQLAFHFDGRREDSSQDDVFQQAVVDLSVSSITARKKWQADFDQLRSWWKTMQRLARWMHRLKDAHPAPRLLVWDTTKDQIPWELYYHFDLAVDVRSRWLGAELEIVRWATVAGTAGLRPAVEKQSAGDWLLMESAEDDRSVSDMLPSTGPAKLASVRDLLVQLGRDDLRFALLMLHGSTENAVDGNTFRFDGVTLNNLEHREMPALLESKAVVLLNGCNTAKLVPIGEQVVHGTTSFTSVFLQQGASSVIATLGEVDYLHARDFVHHLVFPTDGDHRLGSLLRKWRQKYVDDILPYDSADPDHSEEFEAFFQGFMYVCYGHPDSTLHVLGTVGPGV